MDPDQYRLKRNAVVVLKEEADSQADSTIDLDCIDVQGEQTDFSRVTSYDISSSSLIESPLIAELLIAHGLLENGHTEERSVNANDSDSENKLCTLDDNYGPPTFLCVYSLQPPSNWNNVEEDDEENGDYKCGWESCDMYFSCRKDLAQHVNNSHMYQDENSLYRCYWNGCARQGKAINARYRMLIHLRTHTHEKPHGCEVCGKKFSRLENLRIHIRSHTGEKPYACRFAGCYKAYSNSSDLFKHSKTHQEDKPYVCRVEGCDKRYTDPSSLRKHMKSIAHAGESKRKSGGNKPSETHMNNSGNNIMTWAMKNSSKISDANKPYACKVEGCGKRYTDPSSLRKHQRVTLHGRDPNTVKAKLAIAKAMRKKNMMNARISSGAIFKESKSSELYFSDKPTKESKFFTEKIGLDDPKPLDLSVSCPLKESISDDTEANIKQEILNS